MAHRVIAPDSVGVKPASPTGTQGYFSDGPPGTIVPATWLNMIQDEIITALALRGITVDPADDTQLAQLLAPTVQVLTGYLAAGSPVSTTTTMGRAVLAAEDCTAGSVSAGDTRILVAASEDTRVDSANSCALASSNCVIDDGQDHFIAACRADGVDNVIIDGSAVRNAAAIAYRQQTASGAAITADTSAIVAAHDAVVSGPKSAVLGCYDVTNAGTESLVAASEGVAIGPGTASNCAIIASDIDSLGTAVTVAPTATTATCCAAIAVAELAGSTLVSGTGNLAAACAGVEIDGAAGAIRSVVMAVSAATMEGQESAIIGGQSHTVSSDFSAVLGGTANFVDAIRSTCIGGSDNFVEAGANHFIGCDDCTAGPLSRQNVVVLASKFVATAASAAASDFQVMGGVNVSSGPPLWRLDSTVGRLHSTVAPTTGGADYAEWVPNADGVAHAPGRLLSRVGRSVRLASPGQRVVGVVSTTPSIIGGDDSLGWARRHATDEWGRPLFDEIDVDGRRVRVLRPNPEYDPSRAAAHVPRSERPAEWTLVGLFGQLLVAVEEDVVADDFLVAGEAGLGRKATGETRLEVMEIVRPFDPAVGYAQALVLVR